MTMQWQRLLAIKGDFFFRGLKSGWCVVRLGGLSGSHCHCLFVQDPGEQGAKAPCSPLSFSLSHCPLSIVDFPFSCLPAEGVGGGGGSGDGGDGDQVSEVSDVSEVSEVSGRWRCAVSKFHAR